MILYIPIIFLSKIQFYYNFKNIDLLHLIYSAFDRLYYTNTTKLEIFKKFYYI